MPNDNAEQVKRIVTDWTRAISAGDREAILAHHAKDVLMFDFPATVKGIDAYNETWDFFYDKPKGPITFTPSDIQATAGEKVAFVTCAIHCDGTSAGPLDLRLTVGLEKRADEWVITHEHHSVPTTEERFVDDQQRGQTALPSP
ncbi:MAG TPA: nuclear transport factor 2 family protein [Rhizobiaceae bacterium]|nr:nuclear transport factor 2 family protein [Rhizobiaceae bacterium]